MLTLLWDASAFAKRYAPEVGSNTVDALFIEVPSAQMVSTAVSYAETYSILLRKFNLVAADVRLVRTARTEGIRSLNPERVSAADVPAFVSSL